jgi:SAM-dependent methyltransferase
MTNTDWWRDELAETPLRWENDRAYFTDSPADVFTDTQTEVPRRHWSRMRQSHYDWLRNALEIGPGGQRVIDIGCGQSQFHDLLERHYPCGIDFYAYPRANIISDLNGTLPLANNSCDVAVLSNVLEHIFEPRALLAETHRVLANGGHMLIAVPFLIKIHQPPYDFYRYTHFALERLCRETGFSEIRVEPLGNLFDTHDLNASVRARILRRETTGWQYQFMRVVLALERKLNNAAISVLGQEKREAIDEDGFPHSFAVFAKK